MGLAAVDPSEHTMDFKERKAQRAEHFALYVHGWKLRDCIACAGSGRYDSDRSPTCGACSGTGKERYKPDSRTPNGLVVGTTTISPDQPEHAVVGALGGPCRAGV